jgi:hypothetical protein
MRALFTGALGDFIGAESFMTEKEKDSVVEVLWATRNRQEILNAVDLKAVFPNLEKQTILFDDFSDERPTRPWQPGDRFMNIGDKSELNLKCGLNLSQQELDTISDHSLDATLRAIFSGTRKWESSRVATKMALPNIDQFNLPDDYVVIHPWSDAEICGREFNQDDWNHIFDFLDRLDITGVVVNKSNTPAPANKRIIDLTNKTSLKETFSIIENASYCILCTSSLACYATKIFPQDRIWLKGGHEFIFSDWGTYFYHGPFINPRFIVFRDFKILDRYGSNKVNSFTNLDQGFISLI